MNKLTFRPIEPANLPLLLSWFDDAELSRRVSRPGQDWLVYVTQTPGVYSWLVYDNANAVGQVQLDMAESIGYLSLYVRPDRRNRGYGKQILKDLVWLEPFNACTTLIATVEPDNLASQNCVKAAGFVQANAALDEDGLLRFMFNPSHA